MNQYLRQVSSSLIAFHLLAVASLGLAAGNDVSLTAAVPSDVGLCIELDRPYEHWREFRSSAWFERLMSFPPISGWIEGNQPQLHRLAQQAAAQLQISPEELADGILGQQVVIAVWPPTPGRKEPGAGVVLVRASDSSILSRLVERLIAIRKSAGGPPIRDASHAGLDYYIQQPEANVQICLAAAGNVGVLTNSEPAMQQVLTLLAKGGSSAEGLAGLAAYQNGHSRLSKEAVIKAFVAPRAWDSQFTAGLTSSDGQDQQRRQLLLQTWQAAQYWVGSFEVGDRISLETYFQLEAARIPAAWRELIQGHTGAAEFLSHVPSDALVAITGRADLARWIRMMYSSASDSDKAGMRELRQTIRTLFLGWDPVDRLLAGLGPDWGGFLTSSDDGESLTWVAGVALEPAQGSGAAPSVSEIVDQGLHAALVIGVAVHNATIGAPAARAAVQDLNGHALRSITGIQQWPRRMPSAYVCLSNAVFVGSSVEAVAQAVTIVQSQSLAASRRFERAVGSGNVKPSDAVYLDVRGIRNWIIDHRGIASAWLTSEKKVAAETVERDVDRILALLALTDTVAVTLTVADDGIGLSFATTLESESSLVAQ